MIDGLRADGLFEREQVAYVATHVEGRRLAKLGSALRGFWQTARTCLQSRPAIVHVHSSSHASFLRKSLVLLLGRLSGAHTIFHLHGGGFRQFATVDAGPPLRRWIRHTLEASSRVIVLSPGWADFVRELAPRARVEVVPNAVRLPGSGRRAACGADSGAGPQGGNAPMGAASPAAESGRILFLGRIEAAKGVDELLTACARLAPRHPGLRLVLGGEGDLAWARRRARELGIGDRVDLPGWLDGAARTLQLARAWLFCLPSHAEGLPMSMLEAMAAGCPVVVSAVGAIPEAIDDGVDGLLVPPRQVEALACAIERLLLDRALHARLACAARTKIETNYSTEVVCGRLAALYAQLAGERAETNRKECR